LLLTVVVNFGDLRVQQVALKKSGDRMNVPLLRSHPGSMGEAEHGGGLADLSTMPATSRSHRLASWFPVAGQLVHVPDAIVRR
jgi:hypothetical protein